MTFVYFVRHGRASFTGNRISGYLPGVHLSPEGKVQAFRAAEYLKNAPLAAIYASPLERAMETAACIA